MPDTQLRNGFQADSGEPNTEIASARESAARLPRVLFVSYTSDWTGPTHSLRLLLTQLAGRFNLDLALPGDGEFARSAEREGVRVHRFESLRKSAVPALFRLMRKERFDAVYANNTSSSSENALIAAKLAGVPFLCHIRSMSSSTPLRRLLFLRLADATIAVSTACAEAHRTVAGRAPHVVHNGVALDAFNGDRERSRERLLELTGWPPDSVIVVSVGHICPRKAQEFAVEASARLSDKVPAARLLLVGALERDPDYVERIRRLVCKRGLEDRVRLAGFRGDVPVLLQGADVFVHTAVTDPHPRAVIEAMAARLPVVAFSVDGVFETVVSGETGFLVRAGDADNLAEKTLILLREPATRARYGAAARRRALEHFSAEETSRRVGAIIEETIGWRVRDGERSVVSDG